MANIQHHVHARGRASRWGSALGGVNVNPDSKAPTYCNLGQSTHRLAHRQHISCVGHAISVHVCHDVLRCVLYV